MKIEYIQGDLFATDIRTILHGCNAQGVMGSGVARIIRQKYPEAYEKYRKEFDQNGRLKLGTVITVPCGNPAKDLSSFKIIVNAITQEHYGREDKRYVSYDAVADVMRTTNRLYDLYKIDEIAMPKIGAGLGGGDWNVLSAIIESELRNVKPFVYLY